MNLKNHRQKQVKEKKMEGKTIESKKLKRKGNWMLKQLRLKKPEAINNRRWYQLKRENNWR